MDCKHTYIRIVKHGELIYKCPWCGDEQKELPAEVPEEKPKKKGGRKKNDA